MPDSSMALDCSTGSFRGAIDRIVFVLVSLDQCRQYIQFVARRRSVRRVPQCLYTPQRPLMIAFVLYGSNVHTSPS